MRDRIEAAFAPAQESINWAYDAISEYKALTDAFFQGGGIEFVTDIDPQTGDHIRKVRLAKQLPKEFRRKATEALVNARHAFDQATFAARNLTGKPSNKSVYYPWARTPSDLARLLESRGIDKRLWDTFAAHEPYGRGETYTGGDDAIRALAKLANSKHTIGLSIGGHVKGTRLGEIKIFGLFKNFEMPEAEWNPVKNEVELYRHNPGSQVQTDYSVGLEIIFKEPTLPQPMNAEGALRRFTNKAKDVVESLQARCVELLI